MNRIKDHLRHPNDEKKAITLKEHQDMNAASLREVQENEAAALLKDQSEVDGVDVNTQENAALALKGCQLEAACVLKDSHAAHAHHLKKSQKHMDKKMDEKDQVISWVTGGYSVEGNLKE